MRVQFDEPTIESLYGQSEQLAAECSVKRCLRPSVNRRAYAHIFRRSRCLATCSNRSTFATARPSEHRRPRMVPVLDVAERRVDRYVAEVVRARPAAARSPV